MTTSAKRQPPEKDCPRCEDTHRGRYRMCEPCRRRVRSDDPSDRVCTRCGERKPPAAFSNSSNPNVWCRACCRENARQWRERNPDKARAASKWARTPEGRQWAKDYRLLAKYGLTRDDLAELVLASEGRCAICDEATPDLVIDHDHETGAVRGLLCPNCNSGLGFFADSPERLTGAVAYLLTAGVLTDHVG